MNDEPIVESAISEDSDLGESLVLVHDFDYTKLCFPFQVLVMISDALLLYLSIS